MGKFDPPAPKKNGIIIEVIPPVEGLRTIVMEVSTGWHQVKYTNTEGRVEFFYEDTQSWPADITIEGMPIYEDVKFTHIFVPNVIDEKPITLKPFVTPVDDNVLNEVIDPRYDVVDKSLFDDAILIRDRTIVYKWGNIDADQDNLASVCRVFANLIWADWITTNGFTWLDKLVRELNTPTALTVNDDMYVKNLLSYTTPGSWVYSGGKDRDGLPRWPKQFGIIKELYGKPANEVIQENIFNNHLTGLRAWMISDGTMRIGGSIRNLFKFARLMFNRGSWGGQQVISSEYVDRTLAGGPNGDGNPFNLEGYQTHLIRNGSAWEMEGQLIGVPDGFMARSSKSYIIGIPSLGLIMAGKGPEQFQDVFLPQIVDLMMGRSIKRLARASRVFDSKVDEGM